MWRDLDLLLELSTILGGNMKTSGNSVCDHTVVHETCEVCDGTGCLTRRWQLEKYGEESLVSKKDLWLMQKRF